jgi:hypothetical protein
MDSFFTEGNEVNEGALRAALALLPFFRRSFENDELEHPSFSSLPSVKLFEPKDHSANCGF